ncbi:zinc ribbon domain-containing protein [Dictyobacter formicarum]|uniref:Zinc-ribbon domain-containing protein n=1 Tax=Dictyobacter formicarum TaxID=2778368 RepID=A0ABQ3VQ75_9CHLR|nr:zinc ribbon domain-containing protein [Dictyobacter formicarum]GHO88130.1 hypothetical protein KSZ_61360 [Dictyobacter formicarum]
MATVCTHCGTELPREDARFCNNCGTLIPDHLLSPHAHMAANEDALDKINDALDPTSSLSEQVARQPFAQSTRSKKADNSNVTPWLGIQGYEPPNPVPATPADNGDVAAGNANARRLGQGGRLGRKSMADQQSANFTWPEPMTHIMTGRDTPGDPQATPQVVFPVLPSTPPPTRDLRTKVWDDVEDAPTMTDVAVPTSEPPVSQPAAAQSQQEEIEDLPTQSLSRSDFEEEDPTETTLTHLPTTQLSSVTAPPHPEANLQKQTNVTPSQGPAVDEHIDQMPTAQWQKSEIARDQMPSRSGSPDRSRDNSAPNPISYPPVPEGRQQPAPVAAPAATPVQQYRETPLPRLASAWPALAGKATKRTPLVAIVAVVLICALALGGWIALAHPFGGAADITPLQSVTNNTIGFSLEYPVGWSSSTSGTTLKLADSSDTAQITIARSNAGSTDLTKYLQQQATKMEMTDAKAGSATTFADTSWQQISGDFQLSGASYVGTIYAGTHNNQLYTWTQIAPKNVAQDEENLVFAPARSSLHLR